MLVFHGAGMNGQMMALFCGMNGKSDQAGFIAVYPNGTGLADTLLTFNVAGLGIPDRNGRADDVGFTAKLLDDLATVANTDRKRVFATGISNGGFMCYLLAAQLSDRIAAIAPVAGTCTVAAPKPKRPVPIIHFHGTDDALVPFDGSKIGTRLITFSSVGETISTWVRLDGCTARPQTTELPDIAHDGTKVKRTVYGLGKEGAEVVLFTIEGGGHTWPGRAAPAWIGLSTSNISANDLIWEFFLKHPMQ